MGVVDVIMADFLNRNGAQIVQRGVAVPVVKRIEDERGIGVIGFLHDAPGIGEVVNALEKTDVLERGPDAFLAADLQQVRVAPGQVILPLQFQRRRGDNVRRAQSRPQGKPPPRFILHQFVLPALRLAPLADGDDAGDNEPVIGQRRFHIAHLAAAADVVVNVIEPKLNAVVSGGTRQLDFFQQRLRLNGAGVQAKLHRREW